MNWPRRFSCFLQEAIVGQACSFIGVNNTQACHHSVLREVGKETPQRLRPAMPPPPRHSFPATPRPVPFQLWLQHLPSQVGICSPPFCNWAGPPMRFIKGCHKLGRGGGGGSPRLPPATPACPSGVAPSRKVRSSALIGPLASENSPGRHPIWPPALLPLSSLALLPPPSQETRDASL